MKAVDQSHLMTIKLASQNCKSLTIDSYANCLTLTSCWNVRMNFYLLKNLHSITLDGCQLVDDNFTFNQYLRSLDLYNIRIRNLDMTNFQNLSSYSVVNCQIETLILQNSKQNDIIQLNQVGQVDFRFVAQSSRISINRYQFRTITLTQGRLPELVEFYNYFTQQYYSDSFRHYRNQFSIISQFQHQIRAMKSEIKKVQTQIYEVSRDQFQC